MENYLLPPNFNKKLERIKKEIKDKSVIIYGAGELFNEINNNYDLSDFNIIGIYDRKYRTQNITEDYGYQIVPQKKLCDTDYILVTIKNYKPVVEELKYFCNNTKIIPVTKISTLEKLKLKFNKNNNQFVLITQNGKKIKNPKIKNLHVNFSGHNNYLEIKEPFTVQNKCNITCTGDCKIKIGAFNNYNYANIVIENSGILEIGESTTIESASIMVKHGNNLKCTIGNNCMLSHGVKIRTSDSHSLYDMESEQLLNPAEDVTIGNHVWLCTSTLISKGSVVPDNSVIGANAFVNKKFSEENCLIAGTPASIIKHKIKWDRKAPFENLANKKDC